MQHANQEEQSKSVNENIESSFTECCTTESDTSWEHWKEDPTQQNEEFSTAATPLKPVADRTPEKDNAAHPTWNSELSLAQAMDKFYYIYQANDGQQLFLHPLDIKILLNQFHSFEKFPERIEGEILEIESLTQTEVTRKKYRSLDFLPLSSYFQLVEIDLRNSVSHRTLEPFQDELKKRSAKRKKKKQLQVQEKMQEEEEENRKKLMIIINAEDFPATLESVDTNDNEIKNLIEGASIDDPTAFVTLPTSNQDHTLSKKETTISEPGKTPSLQTFSDAVRSPKPKASQVPTKTGQGKYVVFSTSPRRRYK